MRTYWKKLASLLIVIVFACTVVLSVGSCGGGSLLLGATWDDYDPYYYDPYWDGYCYDGYWHRDYVYYSGHWYRYGRNTPYYDGWVW